MPNDNKIIPFRQPQRQRGGAAFYRWPVHVCESVTLDEVSGALQSAGLAVHVDRTTRSMFVHRGPNGHAA
jgi:hypothetical protein